MLVASIFAAPLWVEIIAGLVVAAVIFLVDRGARMVGETMMERENQDIKEHQEQHALGAWAWGLPPDGAGRAGTPSFIKDTWPHFLNRFEAVETTVREQLTPNGGSSLVDRTKKILNILENTT